jgi:hypothetical protein
MKKTRKIKNKKIFLKWLKKSYKNKYSTKDGGAVEGTTESKISGEIKDSDKADKKSTSSKKKAFALAAAVTLGDVAYRLASNPIVISSVVGLGIGTAGLASGGAVLVLVAVGTCAYFKIKESYSKYYTMINVMNDFILLLKKIDIVVRVAIKISQQYQFFIDTKDVNKSLERIFNKFNKLLSIEDIGKIQKDIETRKYDSNMVQSAANKVDEEYTSLVNVNDDQGDEPSEIEPKRSVWSKFMKAVKIIKFDSKKFTTQLNEEVTRLGLYFSILLGEFNIILNVSQMTIIQNRNISLLMDKNNGVKASLDFKKLLISSIIYRTLQIHNIFSLCTTGGLISDASKEITCSEDKIKQYTNEIEAERLQIRTILFGKSTTKGKQPLFPLYQYQGSDLDQDWGLKKLRDIMRDLKSPITEEKKAREFAKTLHDFNEEYSGKKSDSSIGLTNSDNDYYTIDDEETEGTTSLSKV